MTSIPSAAAARSLVRTAIKRRPVRPRRTLATTITASIAMRTQTTATVNHGQLQLDEPLNLPDQARVQVTVELREDWRAKFLAGLQRLQQLIQEQPIRAGIRFTRDELHERS